MLQGKFFELILEYTDPNTAQQYWAEIKKHYTERHRHYHTLQHLEHLYNELEPAKELIDDWHTVLFALFYHDIIYSRIKKDNEEKSAWLAVERLRAILYDEERVQRCFRHIIATKKHEATDDADTNYFTDADLSSLGQPVEKYLKYTKQIRKEYSIYPGFIYNRKRKEAMEHIAKLPRIYKTDLFYNKYETQARANLQLEIKGL